MITERFNLRVYGLLVHQGRVLVADELVGGHRITKFPGGGLELGEGTKDCLVREVREELGLEATDVVHFYTTDFFQPSAYRAGDQIISIYYTFQVAAPGAIPVSTEPFAFKQQVHDEESFRWLDLATAKAGDVTLPIDRVVLGLLLGR
ncbi:MAG: NUDIX domain-containing protein [Flavobacteriales bacterium]